MRKSFLFLAASMGVILAAAPAPVSARSAFHERTIKEHVYQYLKAVARGAQGIAASGGEALNDSHIDVAASELGDGTVSFDASTNTASLSYEGTLCSGQLFVSGSRAKVGRVSCVDQSAPSKVDWLRAKKEIEAACKQEQKEAASRYRDVRVTLTNRRAAKDEFRAAKEAYAALIVEIKQRCKQDLADLGPRPGSHSSGSTTPKR